jgi:hypothetical protein
LGTRIFRPLRFDLLERNFDLRDAQCDFLLLLLQFPKRDDLVADFGEARGLRGAFASEIDFAALQLSLYVSQRQARALPSHFQSKLAQTGADETHKGMLTEQLF